MPFFPASPPVKQLKKAWLFKLKSNSTYFSRKPKAVFREAVDRAFGDEICTSALAAFKFYFSAFFKKQGRKKVFSLLS